MKLTKCLSICLALSLLVICLGACGSSNEKVKIGVSFGVGQAARWDAEAGFMEDKAKELGADIEIRINRTDEPKSQKDDCIEMIDSGIDVLILTPRDVTKAGDILDYAKSKNVPVISYARVVLGQQVDLFVGYDSNRIGQKMGQYISELAYQGDYIILSGDPGDNNGTLLYEGVMSYITPIKDSINIILDAPVPGWSGAEAKKMVINAVKANGNKIDAIVAPNDVIAGACAEAIAELGITTPVAITGMDSQLDALKRIVAGTQSMTLYLDLNELSNTAIQEAVNLGKGADVNVNAEFDNQSDKQIKANLITGQVVTKENLDELIIEPGYFTHEEVYGS